MDESIRSKIQEFEDELKKTKYNKKTQHHIGLVKAKIARLKEKEETRAKGQGKTDGYTIKKSGDATVVMVGFPSVGKSTLLNAITNANSKVAAYEFTTLSMIPGLLEYRHAKIQIFDVPGIVRGAADGTGRGKEVLAAVRSADLIMMLIDINQQEHIPIIEKELYDSGIRLNRTKPDVRIRKTPKGGILVSTTVPLDITVETIKAIMNEFKIINANVLIRSFVDEDDIIDSIEQNKKYVPGLMIINKIDTATPELLAETESKLPDAVFVSADRKTNLEELKEKIYGKLQMIKIWMKEPGKDADMEEPMIMRKGNSIEDVCVKLHRDFARKFRFARVWGKSAKFDGQKITNIRHVLHDEDVLELHIR